MTSQITSFEEYQKVYQQSVTDPEGFWAAQAETFHWRKKWDKVLDWNFRDPDIKWFTGGKLNITENCLDRHLAERGDQVAIKYDANDPDTPVRDITYKELHASVCQAANALKELGVKKGDRVCFTCPWFLNWPLLCWLVRGLVPSILSSLPVFRPKHWPTASTMLPVIW